MDYLRFTQGFFIGMLMGTGSGSGPSPVTSWPLPLPEYKLDSCDPTNLFGCRLNPVTGIYTMHYGWDIQAQNGTELLAIADGVVTQAGNNGGWGNSITVDTGTYAYMYAHRPWSDTAPAVGAAVKEGNIIGHIGETGQTQGGHVHLEIRVNGEAVDPAGYLPVNEDTCRCLPLPPPNTDC